MPNGLRRDKFGQRLPPVQVIFKKMAKIGRDRTWKNQIGAENNISRQVFVLETSQTPLYTPQEVLNNSSVRTRAAPSNPCWDIGRHI